MSTISRWRTWLAAAFAGAVTAALVVVGLTVAPAAHAATIDLNAYYQLVSRHSGGAIDVAGQSTADGAMVQQWSPANQANQQFRFLDSGGGYYRLQARHSGKVLDVYEWNPDNGAEIRQWADLNGTNQQFQVIDTDSGYVKLINRFSGKALDVWEWSTANGGRISQYDDTGGWNQQWQLVQVGSDGGTNQSGLVGWATVNGTTTGGAGGPTVTVTSGSQLVSEMQASGARTIQVSGTISISGMNDVASNKTIIGLGSNATITGGGLDVDGVSNVIIRNLNFRDWGDDAINVQDASHHVWVDHNSLSNGNDGAIDIKRESDYVTVSWNRIFNHDKSMLLGHSDSHTADIGHLRVTYHHNWFDGSDGRHPRVRFGNPVHVYNNYYLNNGTYGVASTMDAGVLVEGNYFQGVDEPTHVGYASSDPGSLVERNNVYNNSGTPESTSGGVNAIPYGYQLDNPNNVPAIVTAGAGAGRI
jgi:pectate lyase